MKFISYDGKYFRPEAVAMVSENQDSAKSCVVHLIGGQRIFFPHPAEHVANFISDVVEGVVDETDDNPDVVNEQMDWHEMG